MASKKILDMNKLLSEYTSGKSAYELAAQYNCSAQCILSWIKKAGGEIRSAGDRQKLRFTKFAHPRLGTTHTDETKQKMSERHADVSGYKNPNYNKGLPGEQNPNWQGGVARDGRKGRNTRAHFEWAYLVKKLDQNTCQLCFKAKERMHVHHIRNWRTHPELRYEVSNGVMLCIACHTRISHAGRELDFIPYFDALVEKRSK
jgi:uncharacterized protein YjcR